MRIPIRLTFHVAGAIILIAALGTTAHAQSANPFLGTWKVNVGKSKYSNGAPPRSSVTTIEAAGSGVKYTVDQVSSTGETLHWEFTGAYDGKDNKVVGKNPNGDSVALTRVGANTVRQVNKLGGKVTITQVAVVSADGKTRTLTATGTNPQGQPVNNVTVYDRQ
jgi:hypothetical protein